MTQQRLPVPDLSKYPVVGPDLRIPNNVFPFGHIYNHRAVDSGNVWVRLDEPGLRPMVPK